MQLLPLSCLLKEKQKPAFAWSAFLAYCFFASISARCYTFNSVGARVKN